MVISRTTPELFASVGVLILPFLFGRGSMAREALSRVKISCGWAGIGSGLILFGVSVGAVIAEQRGMGGIFSPFIQRLTDLNGGTTSNFWKAFRYFGIPFIQIAAWTFLTLLMLSHPKWKAGLALFVGYYIVSFVLKMVAYQLQIMITTSRYGDKGVPWNLEGWLFGTVFELVAIIACSCALTRAFRPSLMPVAVVSVSMALFGLIIQVPAGFYQIIGAIVGTLLVFFVWANQERFGGNEDETGGLEMKVEA